MIFMQTHFVASGINKSLPLLQADQYKGRFPLRRIRPHDQAMGYQGMRSSKSKLKAYVVTGERAVSSGS